MMIDKAIAEIMSSKPHNIRRDWMKDRANKLKVLNVSDRNLRVSKMIDRLNSKISLELIDSSLDVVLSSTEKSLFD